MTLYDELLSRGLIAQSTDDETVRRLLDSGGVTFYIGFDPTADSLHVGHMLQLIAMSHLQRAGHRPIALIGGGTALVGDPSGRTDMRQMLTPEQISHNGDCFVSQMRNLVDFDDGKAIMVNNADWLTQLNYVELLRTVGSHFSVNRMLTAECFKSRMEKGLSFLEFNYMIMQSYDFLELFDRCGCKLQVGGNDQWSNILGGVELIRRLRGGEAYGLTLNLLLTSDGRKMGKTAGGAVWLDPEKTSPFEFYQYWRNVDDGEVVKLLKMITFLPLEDIKQYESAEGAALNTAKERLAYEVTALVHGGAQADAARASAKALFGGIVDNADMPTTIVAHEQLTGGQIGLLDLLVVCGITASKGEGRRLVEQGGVELDGVRQTDITAAINETTLAAGAVIKKGKKIYHKAVLEQ